MIVLVPGLVWWKFHEARWANMIILAAFLISSKPLFEDVWKDPFKETPRSWILWTIAYAFTSVNCLLREDVDLFRFITPVVLLVFHGSIAALSRKVRKQQLVSEKEHLAQIQPARR